MSNGLVVEVFDSQSTGPGFKKYHCVARRSTQLFILPRSVDKLSTRNLWELNGKK